MFKKVVLGVLGFIIFVLAAGVLYFSFFLPDVSEPSDLSIEMTDKRVQRGSYLANHVAVCMTCHSHRQHNIFSQPIDPAFPGAGQTKPFVEQGAGMFYPDNLTPYNLGSWSDGEIYRAITAGVGKNGEALFPIMPYQHYATASREDIYAIIAYLRTLQPIEQDVPESEIEFPLNLIVKTIPADPDPHAVPDENAKVAYGKYLVNIASCSSCHTPKDSQGRPLPGMDFAGGFEFDMPTGGVVRSANITPDEETGISKWSEEAFVNRFKSYKNDTTAIHPVKHNEFNTEMPWRAYSGMNEKDMEAIYAYLQTLEPV